MKLGKLPSVKEVVFTLPSSFRSYLSSDSQETLPRVRFGCPVWGDRSFVGNLYPKHTKPDKYLHFIQKNMIQLN